MRTISRRSLLGALGGTLLLVATACSATVHHDVRPGWQPGTQATYALVSDPDTCARVNKDTLRTTIDEAMALGGFAAAAPDDADVHVAFSVTTERRYRLEGGSDAGIGSLEPGEKQTRGTLHIYVLDPGDDAPVWHGWMSAWLTDDEDVDARIEEAARSILAEFARVADRRSDS